MGEGHNNKVINSLSGAPFHSAEGHLPLSRPAEWKGAQVIVIAPRTSSFIK